MPPQVLRDYQQRGLKECTACHRSLDLECFGRRAESRDGRNARCKDCLRSDPKRQAYARTYAARHPEKLRERSRRHYAKDPAKRLAATRRWQEKNRLAVRFGKFDLMLRNKYKINAEDWARMFNAQNGQCVICKRRLRFDKSTHVDHCHATGAVRALLCHGCNTSIGHAEENTAILRSMIAYIEVHRARARSA